MLKKTSRSWASVVGVCLATSLGWLAPDAAGAATSASNLVVAAPISSNCMISSTAVMFGNYDPLVVNASAPLDGTGLLSVKCTKDSTGTIVLGHGNTPASGSTDSTPERRMTDGSDHFISYFLYSDASRTTTWGNTVATGLSYTGTGMEATLTVYGRIPGGQAVPSGAYADNVLAVVFF